MPSDNNFSKSFKDTLKRLNMIDEDDNDDDRMTNIISNNSQNMAKYVPPNDNITAVSSSNANHDDEYDEVDDDEDDNVNVNRSMNQPISLNQRPVQQQSQLSLNNGRRGRNGDFDEDEIRRAIEESIQDYEQVMTTNSKIAKEQAKLLFEASKNGMVHEIPEVLYSNEYLIEEIFRTFEKVQENDMNSSIIAKQNKEYEDSIINDTYGQQQDQLNIDYDETEDDEILQDILKSSEAGQIPLDSSLSIVNIINNHTEQQTEPDYSSSEQQEQQPIVLSRAEIAAKRLAALSK